MPRSNEFGQPIGDDLGPWSAPPVPPRDALVGRHVTLEPLDAARHAAGLAEAFVDAPATLWTYLFTDPLRTMDAFTAWIDPIADVDGWRPYAAVLDGSPVGFMSYMRIDATVGSIEIGSIGFSPSLQRTTAATETLYLLMARAFELGYRRLEWKCDALNDPSRRAAERLGFRYEGTFRQATHYKRRNRDTAWFSITDAEWPAIDAAFRSWLDPSNFDQRGVQRTALCSPRSR
ncbi:MAG: GNAT family protein [Acidimicrobiia bacterium]|nr:GNAT family protein [Acidimicrobiia bacterium]